MANSSDSNQKLNEEKELSFSISRILQSTCSVKKVEIGYKSEVKCRCAVETQSGKSSSVTEIIKINGEGNRDPRALFPWQILSKHSNRRIGHPYQSRAVPKRKKPRTTFSRAQITELEDLFTEKKYLTSSERQKVASYLNLSDCQVKTWFQNRRTKWKRETEEEKEEQRHALTRTMFNLQKERMLPFQEFHHTTCTSTRT